jgi:hypothetical protein
MSTKSGKHGDARRGTEVPRTILREALEENTELFSTHTRTGKRPWVDVPIPLG